ncbi:SpoIID/LytB domain-containing protein [Aquibacillus saliphilus]|uniref:SpoIID/LytB domain-containing protein n=1 Tax=Aquibacillus saliphilus TaxID=1909422 RepID=UPI001CF04D5C|nr:SpoIID/LytB domain-containing protein [Aquibacillus saliphilus]
MRHLIVFIPLLFTVIFPSSAGAEELVRVRLVNHIGETSKIEFSLQGDYFTLDPTLTLKEGVSYSLSESEGTLLLEGANEEYEIKDSLLLIPKNYNQQQVIEINDRAYLGAMEMTLEGKTLVRPINQLPMEDYLKGVVPFEVFPEWGLETLKAQALAARTYAVTHLSEEMDDTISFQVYGGYTWNDKTTDAVNQTKGEVITFKDKLIDAFYSASNGGITENNAHVWGGKAMPYFPIKKDPHDPTHPWNYTLSRTQIELEDINWDNPNWMNDIKEKDEKITATMKTWLQKHGYPGEIKILSIPKFELSDQKLDSKRSVRGSITIEFLQQLMDGTILFQQFKLDDEKLNRIRPMIGGNTFRSYLIDSLKKDEEVYTMMGRGYGHGVGMSQWGASIMGDKGKTYEQIIEFYYPGTDISQIK